MKKWICALILILIAIVVIDPTGNRKVREENKPLEKIVDVVQFANMTSDKLVGLLGEPDRIEQGVTTGFVELPCEYYEYDDAPYLEEVSFVLMKGRVVRLTAYGEFPYYKGDRMLERLGVDKEDADTCFKEETNTYARYRIVGEKIDDVHITLIDTEDDKYECLQVTYDMLYYEEWYIPMDVEEETKYQTSTKQLVKTILKKPDTAEFVGYSQWGFGKNSVYVIATGYVDAENDFGLSVRSEFAIIYDKSTQMPVYFVWDGEVIMDEGYVPMSQLVQQLVQESGSQEEYEVSGKEEEEAGSERSPILDQEDVWEDTELDAEEVSNDPILIRQVTEQVCQRYNAGNTAFDGKIYVIKVSANFIELEHKIEQVLSPSEKDKVAKMETTIEDMFAQTFMDVFPELITVEVDSVVTYSEQETETPQNPPEESTETEEETQPLPTWVTADGLRKYSLSGIWMGEEYRIFDPYHSETRYILKGTPSSKMEKGVTYHCDYNGHTIRLKYDGEIWLHYQDLVNAGIVT